MKIDLYLYHPRQEEMPAGPGRPNGGFDGLFVAESTSDPFQCLAVASPHTSRVTLGTSVALAFPRSPMLTAVAAWDLQRATHGRHILGLGSQCSTTRHRGGMTCLRWRPCATGRRRWHRPGSRRHWRSSGRC